MENILSSISETTLMFILLCGLGLFILFFVTGIYFYKNKAEICKKYDIDYFLSFIFGAFTLTPLTIAIPALLFATGSESIFAVIMSFVYPVVIIVINLCSSKNKPYRFKRIFVMMLFTVSFFGFLTSKIISSFVQTAMISDSGSDTSDYELRRKLNNELDRRETKAYYDYLNNRH